MNINNNQITLDGVDVLQGKIGVRCTGAASRLKIRRSLIKQGKDGVLIGNGCRLEMDRTLITGNTAGTDTVPLSINASPEYTITNNFIVGNTASKAAVKITDSHGTFSFNTVAGNTNAIKVAGGIECSAMDMTMTPITDTIVFGNTLDNDTTTQFAGTCQLIKTVVGKGDSFTGGLADKDPAFVNPAKADYHLDTKQDNTCCIDKAMTSIDHDYDGATRPKGLACDIGAHEAQ